MKRLTALLIAGGLLGATASGGNPPQVWVSGDGTHSFALAGDNGTVFRFAPQVTVQSSGDADQRLPDTWIGVRVTPVPEALEAHIHRGGLMIANIVEDAPADRAGLERFDVIVSFNGTDIAEMADLTAAIEGTGADRTAEIVIVRGGEERTLTIRPVQRPDTDDWSFRYEEPPAVTEDAFMGYFGHRLQRDDDGNLLLEPLGRLDHLPGQLKDFYQFDLDLGKDGTFQWHGLPDKLNLGLDLGKLGQPGGIRVLPLDPNGGMWMLRQGGDAEADVRVEVQIEVDDDGNVRIKRGADGKITVEREDADGNQSSETYDSMDELREADPDAAEKLDRFGGGFRAQTMITLPPRLGQLPALQRNFTVELQQQLDKAQEQLDRAMQKAHKVRVNVDAKARAGDADDQGVLSEAIAVVNDDGRITVTITRDGETETYEYESMDALREDNPKLYEKIKPFSGDDEEARRVPGELVVWAA